MDSVKLVEYLCTNCLVVNLAPAKYAGRKGKCKNCKEVIDIPVDSSIYIPPKKRPTADLDKKKNPGKKLRRFKCVGQTQDGNESKGTIEATSIENAAVELKKMGIKLVTIDGNSYQKIIKTKRNPTERNQPNSKKRKPSESHRRIRPLIIPGIILFMFSPMWIALLLWFLLGMPKHSGLEALSFLMIGTLPTGFIMLIVYYFVITILYLKNKYSKNKGVEDDC